VLQQQLQLQMSFAWSFLHIGQSMTANLFHSSAPGAGPKAARVLSSRIIAWGVASSTTLALGTYACRHALPSIFTSDPEVTEVVLSAALPAAAMLSLACNSALEGCLLAADEQAYVIRMYPWAVGTALLLLGAGYWSDAGLPGVWLGLMAYYLVLLVGFAARYWLYRGRL
jgi:Na+-driven multidrug efflux pump